MSSSNLIYNNNFVNNTKQVHDVSWGAPDQNFPGVPTPSENIWDNDYPLGGNYWSDYSGMETYVIDENNVDHYPQAQQINFSALAPTPTPTVPEFSSWTILLLLSIILSTVGLLVYHKKHKHNLVKKV